MKDEVLKELSEILSVLGVESRLRIVSLLTEYETLCVNVLAQHLGISQSAVSQHLRILHLKGLVESQRDGYYCHYSLNRERLGSGLDPLLKMLEERSNLKKSDCGMKGKKECAEKEKETAGTPKS